MNPLLNSVLRTLIRTRFWHIYRQPDAQVMHELDATIQRMLQVIGIEGNVADLSFKDGKLTIEIKADRPPWVTPDEWALMAQRIDRLHEHQQQEKQTRTLG
ncbi:hypothetical protein [Candidatus Cyanaurora vandensis]|uniref:hypothetical protein n=1 Tax=Candidatus Cyanaurora vandensis TaxID=2714958 RepID=UPI00257CB72E|nr:hypothetical protein [Candidatus Cyanaurora vandensis]